MLFINYSDNKGIKNLKEKTIVEKLDNTKRH